MVFLSLRRARLAAASAIERRLAATCEVRRAIVRCPDRSREVGFKVAMFDRTGRFQGFVSA